MTDPRSERRVLAVVAEDEPVLRIETVDFLTDEGFEVMDAVDAAQALAVIERLGGVEVLFTDVRMPGTLDGAALAWEVARRWPDTRIIVCSGTPRPGSLPDGAHVFDKPFLPSLVRKVLKGGG